jgi:hypothetical protein
VNAIEALKKLAGEDISGSDGAAMKMERPR